MLEEFRPRLADRCSWRSPWLGRFCGLVAVLGIAASRSSEGAPKGQSEPTASNSSDYAALVNTVSFGIRPPFQGNKKAAEWPVRRSVTFLQPAPHGILVMLEGVLVSTKAVGQYADPVSSWEGIRKSRGGTALLPVLTPHKGIVLSATREGQPDVNVTIAKGVWRN